MASPSFPAAAVLVLALASSATADLPGRIRAYLAPFARAGHLSGTVLVARDGEVLFEESYGRASFEEEIPNTPDTRFCVASVTKPMTIAVTVRLLERGVLAADDTLGKFLPGFPRGDEITVAHLVNHRACIPHRVTTPGQERAPLSAAEMVELVKAKGLLPCEPGEKSVYSSAGFSVLARVLEIASGKAYGDLLREEVFGPAGATSAFHPGRGELPEPCAAPYFLGADGIVAAPYRHYGFLVGAGSVFSTARDVHRILRAALDGKLGESVKANLSREEGVRWNGSTSGYRAFADHHVESGIEVVFLGNLQTGAANRIREALPRIAAGEEVEAPEIPRPVAVAVREDVLRRYEGTYRDAREKEIVLELRDGTMHALQWPLIPTSDTTFFSMADYGTVTVIRAEGGGVERLDWDFEPVGVWPWRPVEGPPVVAADPRAAR